MPSDPPSTSSPPQSSATCPMATAINLPTFPEFQPQQRDTAPSTRFQKYVKRLNNMFTAMSIARASQKKAMLLHYVGEETCDVFDVLPYQNRPKEMTIIKLPSKHLPITLSLRSVLITTCTSSVRKRRSLVKTLPSFTYVFSCWHASVSLPIPS